MIAVRSRRRPARLLGGLFALPLSLGVAWLAGLLVFATTIPDRVEDPDSTTDAIVVLTGGSERITVGLELLEAKRARKMLISGVYQGVEVPELLKQARPGQRSLECCIVLGYAADSTVGNAAETAAWMARERFTSLRLVTAAYHMRRSLLELRGAMPKVRIVPHPVFPASVKADWWRWPGTAQLLVNEYNKYLLALGRTAVLRLGGR